jgi:hypothetical protein
MRGGGPCKSRYAGTFSRTAATESIAPNPAHTVTGMKPSLKCQAANAAYRRYGPSTNLGTFFGSQSSQGRNHVAITGSNGITGIRMSTSRVVTFDSSPFPLEHNRAARFPAPFNQGNFWVIGNHLNPLDSLIERAKSTLPSFTPNRERASGKALALLRNWPLVGRTTICDAVVLSLWT